MKPLGRTPEVLSRIYSPLASGKGEFANAAPVLPWHAGGLDD